MFTSLTIRCTFWPVSLVSASWPSRPSMTSYPAPLSAIPTTWRTGQKVHLIVSDVNMPNMDGITFVKNVKAMPAYRFTPVIMLTTESQEAKKREGQLAGAKAWVVKPFQPAQLLGAVEKLILP